MRGGKWSIIKSTCMHLQPRVWSSGLWFVDQEKIRRMATYGCYTSVFLAAGVEAGAWWTWVGPKWHFYPFWPPWNSTTSKISPKIKQFPYWSWLKSKISEEAAPIRLRVSSAGMGAASFQQAILAQLWGNFWELSVIYTSTIFIMGAAGRRLAIMTQPSSSIFYEQQKIEYDKTTK